tara:strand:+ start:136 stop:423 length:288 start_codon:yes stop_codon:yes gene_type:complete
MYTDIENKGWRYAGTVSADNTCEIDRERLLEDVIKDLNKSRERVKELEEQAEARFFDRIPHLESQVEYLQDKLAIANKSRYRRFKDYIKDRVAEW